MIIDGYTTLGECLSPDSLLRQMDSAGVTRAVIAPENRELAVHNRSGNERLLAAAAKADDRFIPACTVTPWRGDGALSLFREAVEGSARLLVLGPAVQGFMMTDDMVDPLLKLAAALDVPVYVHTGPHSMGAPTQTVLAVQKHPATRFILGHCGTTDHAWDMSAIATRHMSDNLWLEVSLVRPWGAPRLLELAGSDRVIYGSSAPLTDLAFELQHFSRHLPPQDYPGFYHENLVRVLGRGVGC